MGRALERSLAKAFSSDDKHGDGLCLKDLVAVDSNCKIILLNYVLMQGAKHIHGEYGFRGVVVVVCSVDDAFCSASVGTQGHRDTVSYPSTCEVMLLVDREFVMLQRNRSTPTHTSRCCCLCGVLGATPTKPKKKFTKAEDRVLLKVYLDNQESYVALHPLCILCLILYISLCASPVSSLVYPSVELCHGVCVKMSMCALCPWVDVRCMR